MGRTEIWREKNIPSMSGRSVVITGTGGLGFETALELVRAGADVTMVGRNGKKGAEAIEKIRGSIPSANIQFEMMDLADLSSISALGQSLRTRRKSLDILINNAGIMTPPQRKVTRDGFELQFGTNYLGHFALTAHLLPLLKKGSAPRVVTLSSIAVRDRSTAIHLDDLQFENNYKPMLAYEQSKLADLMFAFELQRRSIESGWGITSIAAHPGVASTNLIENGAGKNSSAYRLLRIFNFIRQSAADGALPSLFAATSGLARGGEYYGPDGFNEIKGLPKAAKIPAIAKDSSVAKRLWEISEKLIKTKFDSIE